MHPYAVRFRAAAKRGAFAQWACCFFLAAGAGAEYALALLPVAAAGGARKSLGALVGGGLGIAFVGAAGYFRAYVYGGRNALADHLFLGALAAATPAAHAASALATAAEFRSASAAYGRDGMGMEDAAEALASDAATGADAFALREPEVVSVFRFDLMGQAHATTPLPDANYGYKAGKLERRTNTFNDFVDVAKGLAERGYTVPGRISISGGSAGGELMGAVVNSDPGLWGAVVAHVPFVDVLNTMLDASLPLTPGEWPEWGNPIADKAAFELIRSYSPYDNVRAQDYPPMLVAAGLNDPRVTYWEPAKWVARLRELKTNNNELLLKTNMGAGHGGKSGRFESLRETAEEFAFILWQMEL